MLEIVPKEKSIKVPNSIIKSESMLNTSLISNHEIFSFKSNTQHLKYFIYDIATSATKATNKCFLKKWGILFKLLLRTGSYDKIRKKQCHVSYTQINKQMGLYTVKKMSSASFPAIFLPFSLADDTTAVKQILEIIICFH